MIINFSFVQQICCYLFIHISSCLLFFTSMCLVPLPTSFSQLFLSLLDFILVYVHMYLIIIYKEIVSFKCLPVRCEPLWRTNPMGRDLERDWEGRSLQNFRWGRSMHPSPQYFEK